MTGIVPIPTTRVGDLFVRQRLVGQVQADQLALFRLQTQISSGKRLQLPSDDPSAAMRGINLQRLLDRKGQIRSNLQSSNQLLSAAWDRLGSVSTMLSDLRGEIVGVTGSLTSEHARKAVIQEIDGAIRELVNAGNAKYQGRYLFAGSKAQTQPYSFNGEFVEYFGNQGVLRSFVDLEQLFETNLAGTDVFGGVSASVQGTADLNPDLTSDTLLSSLNGGHGIGANPAISLSVNNGISTVQSVVDLSRAVTIGDVARLIETHAPVGSGVAVQVTTTGLVLQSAGHSISVGEVAQGQTARALGILSNPNSLPTSTLVGGDLNPALLKTTRLEHLLGADQLDVASGLVLTNGGKSMTVDVSNAQTVEDLFNLINGSGLGLVAEINATRNGINVRSRLSGADFSIGENGGTTATQLGIRTFTSSTRVEELNKGLGVPTLTEQLNFSQIEPIVHYDDLVITARDGTQLAINLYQTKTIQDVLDHINNHVNNSPPKVLARLATYGNGIELVDVSGGTDELVIQAIEGSRAAEFLGFIPAGQTQVSTNGPNVQGDFVLQSEDRHTFEADGVFNTLFRLREAVQNADNAEIGRLLDQLDADMNLVSFARAELGARLKNLEAIETRLQDEDVQLRTALSLDLDVDLVQAISDLTARQYAFEASLRTTASLLQMSLLNFI